MGPGGLVIFTPRFSQFSFGVLLLIALFARNTSADVLFVGSGAFTPCAVGALPCHQDPELIGSHDLSIYVNSSNGKLTMAMPTLLILGLPNYADGAVPLIDTADLYTDYVQNTSDPSASTYSTHQSIAPPTFFASGAPGGSLYYNGQWDTTTGKANATLNSGSGTDVYSMLHLAGADNSNNWTNWSAWDQSLGINVTSFSLFVYEMQTPLSAGNLLDVTFKNGGLPTGAFAIAYGCNEANTSQACPTGAASQGTPFTHAGLVNGGNSVPEPPTPLSAIALLLVLTMVRSRSHRLD